MVLFYWNLMFVSVFFKIFFWLYKTISNIWATDYFYNKNDSSMVRLYACLFFLFSITPINISWLNLTLHFENILRLMLQMMIKIIQLKHKLVKKFSWNLKTDLTYRLVNVTEAACRKYWSCCLTSGWKGMMSVCKSNRRCWIKKKKR